jgi:hypothetical protein
MTAVVRALDATPLVMVKPNSVAVAIGDETVLAFDRAGRLYTAVLDGCTYRRGLGGTVLAKGRQPGPGRGVRWCWPCDADRRAALYRAVHGLVLDVQAACDRGDARVMGADEAAAEALLSSIAAWTPERLEAESRRFGAAYDHVGVIPPDQYLAVVLQATEGCAWNRCAFCAFYRGERFRIRTADEFRHHCRAVRELLGEGLSMRRSVFLGEASALTVPTARLLEFLDIAGEELPGLRDVHAFMDLFTARKRGDDLQALAARGLRRVVIGFESGCDELLGVVNKPATAADAVAAVRDLRSAGIAVAVVVLVGLGGRAFADRHVADTSRALTAMGLGRGDILYFSPLVEDPATEYPALAASLGRLSPEELHQQEAAIRDGVQFQDGRPALARYDIRELVY